METEKRMDFYHFSPNEVKSDLIAFYLLMQEK